MASTWVRDYLFIPANESGEGTLSGMVIPRWRVAVSRLILIWCRTTRARPLEPVFTACHELFWNHKECVIHLQYVDGSAGYTFTSINGVYLEIWYIPTGELGACVEERCAMITVAWCSFSSNLWVNLEPSCVWIYSASEWDDSIITIIINLWASKASYVSDTALKTSKAVCTSLAVPLNRPFSPGGLFQELFPVSVIFKRIRDFRTWFAARMAEACVIELRPRKTGSSVYMDVLWYEAEGCSY